LQSVAFAHKAYLRLIHLEGPQRQYRAHSYGAAAQLRRHLDAVCTLLGGPFSADPVRMAKLTFLRSRTRTGCGSMAILFGRL